MANDTDMWNDIEALNKLGRNEQADDLTELFRLKFIEGDDDRADVGKGTYQEKYGSIANYW